jgi:hypothetical protein
MGAEVKLDEGSRVKFFPLEKRLWLLVGIFTELMPNGRTR